LVKASKLALFFQLRFQPPAMLEAKEFGFVWLCFFAVFNHPNPHKPLLLLILHRFAFPQIGFVFSN